MCACVSAATLHIDIPSVWRNQKAETSTVAWEAQFKLKNSRMPIETTNDQLNRGGIQVLKGLARARGGGARRAPAEFPASILPMPLPF